MRTAAATSFGPRPAASRSGRSGAANGLWASRSSRRRSPSSAGPSDALTPGRPTRPAPTSRPASRATGEPDRDRGRPLPGARPRASASGRGAARRVRRSRTSRRAVPQPRHTSRSTSQSPCRRTEPGISPATSTATPRARASPSVIAPRRRTSTARSAAPVAPASSAPRRAPAPRRRSWRRVHVEDEHARRRRAGHPDRAGWRGRRPAAAADPTGRAARRPRRAAVPAPRARPCPRGAWRARQLARVGAEPHIRHRRRPPGVRREQGRAPGHLRRAHPTQVDGHPCHGGDGLVGQLERLQPSHANPLTANARRSHLELVTHGDGPLAEGAGHDGATAADREGPVDPQPHPGAR